MTLLSLFMLILVQQGRYDGYIYIISISPVSGKWEIACNTQV